MGDDEASTSVLLVRFNEDADRAAAVERLREDFPDTVLVTPVPARPLPGGLALGAIGWRSVVRSVGLEQSLSAPVMTTMLVVIAVPAVIIALTWWPARRAAASHPAITLRSE